MDLAGVLEGVVLGAGIVLMLWWVTGRAPSIRPANVAGALLYAAGLLLLKLIDAPVFFMYALPFVVVVSLWLVQRRARRIA